MGIYINPGNQNFQRAVNSEIYVDKTELIAYTNKCLNTQQGFLCVSRPRRFGKSMALYLDCLKDYSGKVLLVGINYEKNSNGKKHSCVIEEWERG